MLLKCLFGTQSTTNKRNAAAWQLNLEQLQDHIVPANISLSNGTISVDGTSKDDVVKIELEQHNPKSVIDDRVKVSLPTPTFTT